MSRSRFLQALQREGGPAAGPATSIVSVELMDHVGVSFPEAHLDAQGMTLLAEAGRTLYGFDVVMPLFSVCHESAALGVPVDWGGRSAMPAATRPIWQTAEDVRMPRGFLRHEAVRVPLESISLLKKRLGEDAAVCGKVLGPWTLGYHTLGIEAWLINTLDDPDMIKRAIEKMKKATIAFGLAQLEAGADCLMLADHATRDLCSPTAYGEFLEEVHAELAALLPCPVVLHICGDTSDRIGMIAQTGVACFHWDTRLGDARKARSLAGDRIALMGGINNTEVLRRGSVELIEARCEEAAAAGIDIIAPECAVPLDTPMRNLSAVGERVAGMRARRTA